MADPSKILVLGSMAHETLLIPSGGSHGGYRQQAGWVGAPLLREMIAHALVELPHDPARSEDDTKTAQDAEAKIQYARVRPDEPSLVDPELVPACVHITSVFKRVPKTSRPKDSDSVLRVSKDYSSYPPVPEPKDKPKPKPDAVSPLTHQMQNAITDCKNPDILVLFDFSDDAREAARGSLPTLADGTGRRMTIVGFVRELDGKALRWLEGLTPAVTGGPERTVAVLRAEELRKAGQIIVESGPIERTMRDLVANLEREPLATIKKHASQLVVLFEEVGAVHLNLAATCAKERIHLSSNLDTIAHDDDDKYGRTPGRLSITLVAIARRLASETPGAPVPDLSGAIRLSLVADQRYFTQGFAEKAPLETLQTALSYWSRQELKALLEGDEKRKADSKYFLSTLSFPRESSALAAWTRLDDAFSLTQADRLRNIVLYGPETALQQEQRGGAPWYPEARILCPFMRVGDLRTFDEDEIAGYTSLMRLFRKYLHSPEWTAPLSIGVFGPPGTGKSFGVKELLKSVNPAAEKPLTFNMSQLSSVEALNDAFRDVQHRVLSSDDVPLVFFDEFDATFERELGWLKYFLAPMQDGVFRGKAADYSIGRAFFVFAGGTTSSFAEFKERAAAESESEADAKAAKLPDFVSRLQGFLDIQSINPPGSSEVPQKILQRRVKRALLLRSSLERHAKEIFRKTGADDVPEIDRDLIDALLGAERYVHGSRSLESIVRMSKWVDGRFVPTSLPPRPLLEMHVSGLTLQKPGGAIVLC